MSMSRNSITISEPQSGAWYPSNDLPSWNKTQALRQQPPWAQALAAALAQTTSPWIACNGNPRNINSQSNHQLFKLILKPQLTKKFYDFVCCDFCSRLRQVLVLLNGDTTKSEFGIWRQSSLTDLNGTHEKSDVLYNHTRCFHICSWYFLRRAISSLDWCVFFPPHRASQRVRPQPSSKTRGVQRRWAARCRSAHPGMTSEALRWYSWHPNLLTKIKVA